MTRQVSVEELGANLAAFVGHVHDDAEPLVVEREGKPVAVLISSDQFEQFQEQARARFFAAAEELSRLNADEDPDEVLRFVTEVVEHVRQEVYEREQGGGSSNA